MKGIIPYNFTRVPPEDYCFFCPKSCYDEPLYPIRIEGITFGMCEKCYRTKLRGTGVDKL